MGKSKNDILELYAANAPFGANVVGIEAAAWRWFGRSSGEL
jgi:penicillin-binding protein 1C